jgi:hypothetical protein
MSVCVANGQESSEFVGHDRKLNRSWWLGDISGASLDLILSRDSTGGGSQTDCSTRLIASVH